MIPSPFGFIVILSTLASVLQLVLADSLQHPKTPHQTLPLSFQSSLAPSSPLHHSTLSSRSPSTPSSPPPLSSSSSLSSSTLPLSFGGSALSSATKVDTSAAESKAKQIQNLQIKQQQRHQQPESTHTESVVSTSQQKDLVLSKKTTGSIKDKNVLDALEKAFLKNAGLTERPRINSRIAVPQYMLDLYKDQVERPEGPSQYIALKGKGLTEANTVRSFFHDDVDTGKCKPPFCHRINFDLSIINEKETLTAAELRIFIYSHQRHGGNTTERSTPTAKPQDSAVSTTGGQKSNRGVSRQRIEIHEIMRPAAPDGEVISRLVDTKTILHKHGNLWHSFDVHPAVLRWKRGSKHNHGLEVRIIPSKVSSSSSASSSPSSPSSSKRPSSSLSSHVDKHGIRVRRSTDLPDTEWTQKRPLLVVFTNDGSTPISAPPSSFNSRGKRSANKSNRNNSKNKRRKGRKKYRGRKKKKRKRKKGNRKVKGNRRQCKVHALYVDFAEVGWDDWIVAPPGYPANYCDGECWAPLQAFADSSNHAFLQARLYSVKPHVVPMVCCVPVDMAPISMLYLDQNNRTIMHTYQDMVVNKCGCT